MKIEVKGHSGCNIDVVRENNKLYVYKSSNNLGYLNRLELQGLKQRDAAFNMDIPGISVPIISEIHKTDSSVTLKMNYVYSKNFVNYFEYAGFEQITNFINAMRKFLIYEIRNSTMGTVKGSVLKEKFIDVKNKTLSNPVLKNDSEIIAIIDKSEHIFNSVKDMQMPIGKCHGDLTFSNILFSDNNYHLIDFLDSFVESPLLDIVKLRQDSAYLWSQLMYSGNCDTIRLKIIAKKIDSEIDKFASQFDWYNDNYKIFQLMNFLRILQYAKDTVVINYLKNVINQLLYEF
jgi:tRNA A-37 threonylcarbamoyl transferase component Bud32